MFTATILWNNRGQKVSAICSSVTEAIGRAKVMSTNFNDITFRVRDDHSNETVGMAKNGAFKTSKKWSN